MIYLDNLSSQFRLNSKIINLILDLHLRIIKGEPTVNKTLIVLKIKQSTHSLLTSSLSRIQIHLKEFNSQLYRIIRSHNSSPTPCSCKAASKTHNNNTSNSSKSSNNNSKQTNTSSIRRRWRNSNRINRIRCNMVLDSKVSNSQCQTKDNSGQPCHSMDNSNSSKM